MKRLRRPSEGWKKSSGMACPGELHLQLCQRKTRRPTLRDWRLIPAFALLLIALSPSFSTTIASTNASSEMRRGGPRSVRIPAIDGDDIRFSRLSTAQGLSQTQANQIVQDDQGFIWVGTQYGLDRYDGYEFKAFTHDPAHANTLSCSTNPEKVCGFFRFFWGWVFATAGGWGVGGGGWGRGGGR